MANLAVWFPVDKVTMLGRVPEYMFVTYNSSPLKLLDQL